MLPKLRTVAIVVVVLLLAGVILPSPAAAQATAITGLITPLGGSTVNGVMSVAASAQGGASVSLSLIGLQPGAGAQVNLNAGTCSLPSASVLNLVTVTADGAGRAAATVPVTLPGGSVMPFQDVADGDHVVVVIVGSVAVACGAIPASDPGGGTDSGGGSPIGLGAALLAEGERRQLMQFNPAAALQKRIFADGFVPNSGEFSLTLESTTFLLQRAEHLRTGAVRVYFARQNDWGNVRYVQRGAADAFGRLLLDEAERRLAIRFNSGAALQRRVFADAFVPNSPEFTLDFGGARYTGQRAEHLQTGRVRIYYAITGQWNNVRYVERAGRSSSGATLTFSPAGGPSGALVRLTGTGFPPGARVTAWGGPVGSEGTALGTATTDTQGRVTMDVSVVGAVGMRWVFGLVAGNVHAESGEYVVTS